MAPATRLVALLVDRPALGLRRGDVGTVVHIYGSGSRYEVEFINRTGGPAKGLRGISFQATGESTVGIEFYSWDFDYKDNLFKAEILLDKIGAQTWKFKPVLHHIAVKVVDNDGLESVEVLKVNGNVERQP